MSDPLAEMLAPILEHHVYNGEYGDCTCGWPGLDVEVRDSEQWSDHISPLIAAAARAFIANEIHERCNWVDGTGELDDGEVYQKWGIEQAESIARGDAT